MEEVVFAIYNAGTSGKLIKTEDPKFSYLNTGMILNVTLYNNMMRISTTLLSAGYNVKFIVGGNIVEKR